VPFVRITDLSAASTTSPEFSAVKLRRTEPFTAVAALKVALLLPLEF
jgi:hypothetical protein